MNQSLHQSKTRPIAPPGLMEQLGRTEIRRRVWHMTPGILPFLLWPIPHADPISPTLHGVMIVIALVLGAAIFVQYRRIARGGGDRERLAAVGGYAGSVLLMLLLFPEHAELGLTVLAVLAFGDGSATLGGKLLKGPTLPWNREKTVAGMACFIIAGVPLASIVYWGETHNLEAGGPAATWTAALLCGGSAACAGAVFESIRSRVNDNIRVGLAAAVGVFVAHGMTAGWSAL